MKLSLWKSMQKKMKSIDICKAVINDYLKVNCFKDLEDKYGAKSASLSIYVQRREKMISKECPELYDKFIAKRQKNKDNPRMANSESEIKSKNKKIDFDKSILDGLPKKIKYGDFLNYICQYNTGNFTGSELVEIASSRGIKVII